GRQAGKIAEREEAGRAAGNRAPRSDVRADADANAGRNVAEVVDNRILADLEVLGMANPRVRGNDRLHTRAAATAADATGCGSTPHRSTTSTPGGTCSDLYAECGTPTITTCALATS